MFGAFTAQTGSKFHMPIILTEKKCSLTSVLLTPFVSNLKLCKAIDSYSHSIHWTRNTGTVHTISRACFLPFWSMLPQTAACLRVYPATVISPVYSPAHNGAPPPHLKIHAGAPQTPAFNIDILDVAIVPTTVVPTGGFVKCRLGWSLIICYNIACGCHAVCTNLFPFLQVFSAQPCAWRWRRCPASCTSWTWAMTSSWRTSGRLSRSVPVPPVQCLFLRLSRSVPVPLPAVRCVPRSWFAYISLYRSTVTYYLHLKWVISVRRHHVVSHAELVNTFQRPTHCFKLIVSGIHSIADLQGYASIWNVLLARVQLIDTFFFLVVCMLLRLNILEHGYSIISLSPCFMPQHEDTCMAFKC